MKVVAAILGGLFTLIAGIVLYAIYAVCCVSVVVGAVWVAFKIFGIDIEGFTA